MTAVSYSILLQRERYILIHTQIGEEVNTVKKPITANICGKCNNRD